MSVTVVGLDGRPLAAAAADALTAATLVVGAERHLSSVEVPVAARTVAMGDVAVAVEAVARHDGPAVVLASGDPGFFGIVRRLRAAGLEPVVHAAASSVALAFAAVGVEWDDAVVLSAHGRDPAPALAALRRAPKAAVLTDGRTGPREVAAALAGRTDRRLAVAERLGTPDQRVTVLPPDEVAARDDWAEPNVVLVLTTDAPRPAPTRAGALPVPTADRGWALPDTWYAHRAGMVTKAEVRALVLARLGPRLGDLVWDVGAGSGSVAVECARLGAAAVAVERDPEACSLVRANALAHGVPVDVLEGAAPSVLEGLAAPDAVFVGGGGPDVVAACAATGARTVVVALAAVDRVAATRDALRAAGRATDGVQLSAARLRDLPGGASRLAATNPVTVLWGERW